MTTIIVIGGVEIVTLGDRIKLIRGTESREKFAPRTGVSKTTLVNYESNLTSPPAEYLNTLLELFPEYNPTWLLTNKGPIKLEQADSVHEQSILYRCADAQDLEKEYVLVPRYNVRVSIGGGALVESEQVVDHLAFKSSWIRSTMHLNPADLLLVSTIGDSMFPTINEGDLLLVDKGQRDVRDDAIYVLRFDNTLIAKRLQRLYDGSIQIKSDNKAYDPQLVPYDRVGILTIIGRVVWIGGRV